MNGSTKDLTSNECFNSAIISRAETMTAPREPHRPPSPPDRRPSPRGGHPSPSTASAAGRSAGFARLAGARRGLVGCVRALAAAALLALCGGLALPATAQAQEYTPLPGLRVSDGRVQYLFFSAGQCINLSNSSINGVVYTTHTSKWQRRDGATWVDVPGTERYGVCAYSTTNPGEYRLVAEISIGGQRGFYSSENTFIVEGMTPEEMMPPPVTEGLIYYFPHLAVGADWQTTITYINYSPQEVSCTTEFISDQGSTLMVSFADKGTVVSRTDVLPPGGSVHQETNVELNAPFAPGWARAICTGPVKASLLFRLHNSEGMPIAEGGVNATTVPATRFVTFAEQGEGQPGTGVAYANPSGTEAVVTFTAKDVAGQTLESVVRTLLPGEHDAQSMAPLFGLSSFTGSLEVTSTAPIVSLSINAEAAPVFSSLPSGELDVAAQGSTTYYFPHLAVGQRWQTTITYINYSSQEVSCQTEFLSDQGSTLMVSFADKGTVVSRPDVLPPGGSVHQETNVELNAPFAPGWARAICTGPVKASLLFRLHNSEGVPIAEGGVNAAAVPATRFVTFAEQGEGQPGTGVAYANPSDTSALVTFTVRDADGEMLASVDKTLLPNGHDAQSMAPLFGLSSFTGSLEITSTEPIVTLSINAEAAPVFSSLPPGELDAAPDVPGVIPMTVAPDLVVQSPSVSDSTLNEGESFTFSATVHNQGTGESAATTLRYYRSTDATISTGDTEVGTDAVSALAASSTSNQSISLTAPSTAGTYYYGACVDPVSGESNSLSNCSTDVRLTVGASQMEIENFDLDAGNTDPEGITFANDKFYVVDETNDKVYAYDASSQRDSASDFDLDSANGNAKGITFANDRFYVTDSVDGKVYAYQSSGQRDSASDFELDPGNGGAAGITFANDKFYVVDAAYFGGSKKVFAYHASGQRDSASDFVLASNSDRPAGITFANDRFYVVDWMADDEVYAYDASGRRDSASDFDLDADNVAPNGITFANGGFYVLDFVDDRVYAYEPERDTGSVFDLDSANGAARGITFANGRFYVVDIEDDKVYAYQSSGQRDSASDFDLDADNVNPNGITFANNKFYVVNITPSPSDIDNVYAYHASGQRDTASDFDLDADNTDPEGITFANDKFYVVDQTDDKVYAYDASGQRDTASDFDLDSDNGDATGITFANDRFYVADNGDDFVYAYDASGQRESAYDHYLDPDNGVALGITFANGNVYVVDRYDGVYVLNSTGPSPDLEIPTASVSPSTPLTGQSFEFRATVRNRGTGTSTATTLRYYRSFGYTISASDTQVGTDAVGALSPQATSDDKTITLTAPAAAGTYFYGACVGSVSGEPYTDNNCSSAARLTVGVRRPDLVVEPPSVSNDTPGSEGPFVLTTSVRNQGTTASTATTLRYYRSEDRRISTDDTEVGTGAVSAVAADGASSQTITLTAPSTDGTYYYGACVDQAAEELRTFNNCSTGVAVFVGGPYPAYDLAISAASLSHATFVGQSIYMSVTVTNRGPNRSQPAKLRFGSSTYRDIPALDPDATTTPERAFAGTARRGGTVSAEACIVEAPGEENKANNCESRSVTYQP